MNNDGEVEMEDAGAEPDTSDTQTRVGSPSVSGSGLAQLDTEDSEEGRAARDAQTNTTSNEPMVLTCSVCKHQLNSAWSLMQHMQVQSLSDVCCHCIYVFAPAPAWSAARQ